jgi:UDP-4-amino-4-deoxy-L-arabinose-oxoglutarate aminotransferase
MRAEFLPFSRPCIGEAEIAAVGDVLRSGWITTGEKCARFERRFADTVGCREAIALSSATAGMHLALTAAGVGPGDEVITPSLTWVSTVNLITLSGARPVFADVDRDTLMVTADTVAPLVGPRTRLIIPVHYAGAPADMAPLRQLAAEHGVGIIEDAAHALGTAYRGEPVGKQGTAIFSFHPIKNITTAEGGMFCTDDPQLAETVRRLKFHGLGVDAYDRRVQGRAPQAEVLSPGYKYNLPDVLAVLGLGQLERLEAFNRRRRELARYYLEKLASVGEIQPLAVPGYPHVHAWHLFVVRLDIERSGMDRLAFMAALKKRNIGTGLHFLAAHRQKYYREHLPVEPGSLPATEYNSERILSLPLFPDMRPADVDDVIEAIRDVLAA